MLQTVFAWEGLPIPRDPAEIVGGDGYDVLAGFAKVVTKNGKEVTREFVRGAEKALELCLEKGITRAVLKSKSPSCGQTHIYDGTFSKVLRKGCGVTAALLTYYGIKQRKRCVLRGNRYESLRIDVRCKVNQYEPMLC